MSGPPYADPSDVAAIWRPLSTDEEGVAGTWIEVASQQIRDEVPLVAGLTVDERLASGSLSQQTVRDVVRQMVRHIMNNPNGVASHSEAFGTFSQSDTFGKAVAGGEMFISASQMARLTASQRGRQQTAFTIGGGPTFSPNTRSRW